MIIIYTLSLIILTVAVLWIIMIKPSGKKHPKTEKLRSYLYAHRGLHGGADNVPENSMKAFRLAVMRNFGIELDLHLSADGTPVVMHDDSLLRTADENIKVFDIPDVDIKKYRLEKTEEKIPFFKEVIDEVAGRVPLLIELKIDKDNYAQSCDKTMELLRGYTGLYAIQSFDPRAVRYMKKHYPKVMRGQLAGFLRRNGDDLKRILDFGLRNLLTNFLTKPHFISYRIQDTDDMSISLCRLLYKPLEFNWTCHKRVHHEKARKNGAVPIFEDYVP